ncbi:rRNA maturation RNase YbeY [Congregibacter litoralis]|uniref:Endoribonuclease YbeY n=1 Tax=Congregibacter litoralis KT71 TaxID=314285 RepID=A4AA53_9GAMM|nr:rRNA maturation RNase YbeY [Congregibacter litoralis]EAQ97370.1 metalloprotein, YbeY family [Congregibacter litoralis KT71]
MLTLDVFRETVEKSPDDQTLLRAAETALTVGSPAAHGHWEAALRIVDEAEMQQLNAQYRARNTPTNVLSFPADLPADVTLNLLGDIVICAPVVKKEATNQGKPLAAHWDHMLVHGVLHLLGFDHESDAEATHMESLETQALATLGWPCPYNADPAMLAEVTPG